jgi:hypothetical protein
LRDLGLEAFAQDQHIKSPTDSQQVRLQDILGEGAFTEDNAIRAFNHFFDPTRNAPLTRLCSVWSRVTSPNWAPARPGQYTLVGRSQENPVLQASTCSSFKGDMGEEQADPGQSIIGAVAAKQIVPKPELFVLALVPGAGSGAYVVHRSSDLVPRGISRPESQRGERRVPVGAGPKPVGVREEERQPRGAQTIFSLGCVIFFIGG